MTWQTNLFNNLLTVGILLSLAVIIYSKVSRKTIGELVKEVMEGLSTYEQV